MKRIALTTIATVVSVCWVLAATPGVSAAAWDLAADWSTTSNPAGAWEYGYYQSADRQVWTKFTYLDSAWWGGPPSWCYGDNNTPAIFKGGVWDVPGDRIGCHSPQTYNGPQWTGYVAAKWTAPQDVTVSISGGVWIPYEDAAHGPGAVLLLVDNVPVIDDVPIPDRASGTNSGYTYSLSYAVTDGGGIEGDLLSIPMTQGQTVVLGIRMLHPEQTELFAGAAGGMDLQIVEAPTVARVETPTFSPAGGTYSQPQNVAIGCATSGATVYYTTDGTNPNEGSTLYTGPISVDQPLTLKARAYKSDLEPSALNSATYRFGLPTPTFTPDGGFYKWAVTVTIAGVPPDATVYYTTDGSDPTHTNGQVYSDPLAIDRTLTLKARAYKPGADPSAVKSADFTILSAAVWELADDWSTSSNPAGPWEYGYYASADRQVWTSFTYLDSAWWGGPPAWAYEDNNTPMAFKSIGAFGWDVPIGRVACHTPQTYNGPDWTGYAAVRWTAPKDLTVSIFGGVWIAYEDAAHGPGAVLLLVDNAPVISDVEIPNRATLTHSGNTYSLSQAAADGGGTPSSLLNIPMTEGQTITLGIRMLHPEQTELFAGAAAGIDFIVAEIGGLPKVSPPIFSPDGGTSGVPITVTISTVSPNTTIYYTTDGSEPSDTNGQAYAGPVVIDRTLTLKARAYKPGYEPSSIKSADYVIKANAPVFSPPGGFFRVSQDVTISCSTPGTSIYYTTDGSEPTDASTLYQGPIRIETDVTLKARAYYTQSGQGLLPSDVTSATYTALEGWDLAFDWSTTINPAGPWEYGYYEGLDHQTWTTFTYLDPSWHGGPPSWAYSDNNTPNLFKSGHWDTAGHVGGQTPQTYNGPQWTGYVAAKWTAPQDLTVSLSGGVWIAYEDANHGPGAVLLLVDNVPVINDVPIPNRASGINSGNTYKLSQAIVDGGGAGSSLLSVPMTQGQTVVLAIRMLNADNLQFFAGAAVGMDLRITSLSQKGIADIRKMADGKEVRTGEVIVTAVFGDTIYVEQADRSAGIRVDIPGGAYAVGRKGSVTGVIMTDPATGERYVQGSSMSDTGTGSVRPLMLTNKALGGGRSGIQQGISGAAGLNNIGLLIKTTGKVSNPGDGVFYVEDGSGGPVKVIASGGFPDPNAYVAITGISSCEKAGDQLLRVIRATAPFQLLKAP